MKIKRFKMKPDADISVFPWSKIPKIIHGKVSYVNEDSICGYWDLLCHEISVIIAFSEDLSRWNDFDYVLVLDEEFCQPYGPFYHFMSGEIKEPWNGLKEVIEAYNEFMSSLIFLEEIDDENLS